MLRVFLMSVACLWWSLAALATPISGQNDPAFQGAVTAWLEDDEETAIRKLSEMAARGHAASQILLAIIDKAPELQGPWLSMLPAADRHTLMRAPGGLSGQSWMRDAARTEPLAELWVLLWDVDAPIHLGVEFMRHGEDRAAREAILALFARQRRGFADIVTDPEFPVAMRFIAALEDPQIDHDAPIDLNDMTQSTTTAAEWLRTAPEGAALRALCDSACADTSDACAMAAYRALGSHQRALSLGSPLASVIPTEVFVDSPKGQAVVLRKIMLSTDARGRINLLTRTKAEDMCLANVMSAEFTRYRVSIPTGPTVTER